MKYNMFTIPFGLNNNDTYISKEVLEKALKESEHAENFYISDEGAHVYILTHMGHPIIREPHKYETLRFEVVESHNEDDVTIFDKINIVSTNIT